MRNFITELRTYAESALRVIFKKSGTNHSISCAQKCHIHVTCINYTRSINLGYEVLEL